MSAGIYNKQKFHKIAVRNVLEFKICVEIKSIQIL